jgi:TonB family protein
MKKILSILILTLACIVGGHAQELSVQSFMLAETDLTANTPGTMVHDQNGNVCALIKVETTQKGFTFDVGVLGVMSVVEKPAEIWVYVPFGVRKITIQHPQLGMLRDYQIPCAIEKGRTYIMKLTAGNVRTIVEHAVTRQFLYVELDPADAILEINGKIKATEGGTYQELMPFGKYTYKVYCQNYHDLTGIVEISDPANTHNLNLKLRAAFGYLSVPAASQSDLAGASVYVDDKYVGQAPISNLQLSSGSHSIRIIKEMYESYNSTFTISDEENKMITPALVPDFAEVTLKTGNGADIYINGERKGKASWKGRLASGSYMFESRQQGHIPYQMPFDITNLDNGKTITIDSPTPIYGSLVISSTPAKAKISINGVYVGDTPKFISNQIIGKYTVTAEKEGYEKQTKTVEVAEGAEASLSFQLSNSKAVVESPADGKSFVLKVKGIEYPMIFVEGGTFMMGAENRYASDEKPIHEVKLDSYTIGKYEVTQDLWEAVMGSNPSGFSGSRRPVEIVSWNDCQEFISKLNRLTGKTFKLPTEAQWEFAARGGRKSQGYKYSGSNTIDNVAWHSGNSTGETHVVGTKAPNELGIHDMSGNVWEWCSDWEGPYNASMQTNPSGVSSGSNRILRGGCWSNNDGWVTNRFSNFPDHRHISVGFRLCMDLSSDSTAGNHSASQSTHRPVPVANVPEDDEEPIPFQLVEVKPTFMGGDANKFSTWVNQRLVYPEIAKENGVQGRVTLQFTVGKDGSLYNIKVLRGVDPSLDKEAVRVASLSPKWTPGMQRGEPVPVTYTFPVIFQLR